MVATYTLINKKEFHDFIKKIYRGYKIKEIHIYGEYVYDIFLDDNVAVRVYSSIQGHDVSARVGDDAIRCVLFGTKINKPINKKSAGTIVKRTQNWKHALLDRIYAFIEEYHDHKDFYDDLASASSSNKTSDDIYYANGNAYPIKDKLKSMGFRWDPDNKKWIIRKKVDVSHLPITLEKLNS
jgi:hypothetical protein